MSWSTIRKIKGERSIKRQRAVEGERKKAYSRKERRRGKCRNLEETGFPKMISERLLDAGRITSRPLSLNKISNEMTIENKNLRIQITSPLFRNPFLFWFMVI